MKKLFIVLFLIVNVYSSTRITLQELVAIASSSLNLPIVLDKTLSKNLYIYTQSVLTPDNVKNILTTVLKNNNLHLVKHNDFYLLEQIKKEKSLVRSYFVKYLTPLQIKSIFNYFKQDYLYLNNKVVFTCLFKQYLDIYSTLKQFDTPTMQKKIKISIIETNFNKLKKYGIDYLVSHHLKKNNFNINFNNLVSHIGLDTTFNGIDISLNALITNGVTKIVTSPTLTLRNKKITNFQVTKTIPVLHSINTVDTNNKTVVNNKISYDSFGIKINIKPILYNDYSDLHLTLSLQDIDNNKDKMPTTSNKYLVQDLLIKDNKKILVTSFSKVVNVTNQSGIPILNKIPVLGYLFKWDFKNSSKLYLQILMQVQK